MKKVRKQQKTTQIHVSKGKHTMATEDILAAAFSQEAQARQALQALQQAGFAQDQVGVAPAGQNTGTLSDDLRDLGMSHKSAKFYAQQQEEGATIISVRPDGREEEAHTILHQYGGFDYEHRHEGHDGAHTTTATHQVAATSTTTTTTQDEPLQARSLRLREERLNVDKQRVQAGQVGLHKEVVEEQKTIDVPVTHEEVYIERRPVTDGTDDGTPIGTDEQIRVPVSAEQVNVSKNTVATGEVVIGKRQVEETQRVSDTVRHEEARLDQQGTVNERDDRNTIQRDEE
jgi:uncharacterized protein (TIGR02271 family)